MQAKKVRDLNAGMSGKSGSNGKNTGGDAAKVESLGRRLLTPSVDTTNIMRDLTPAEKAAKEKFQNSKGYQAVKTTAKNLLTSPVVPSSGAKKALASGVNKIASSASAPVGASVPAAAAAGAKKVAQNMTDQLMSKQYEKNNTRGPRVKGGSKAVSKLPERKNVNAVPQGGSAPKKNSTKGR